MADNGELEQILAPITAWARSRPDILGLALLGSWARGTARPDSDIDLLFVASEPQAYRYNDFWLTEISWPDAYVAGWRDADYGVVWSRHVQLEPMREIEFSFCAPSWAATDPVDAGTANVVANGCRILLDKSRLLEKLLAVVSP